jgi:hypothetical protein
MALLNFWKNSCALPNPGSPTFDTSLAATFVRIFAENAAANGVRVNTVYFKRETQTHLIGLLVRKRYLNLLAPRSIPINGYVYDVKTAKLLEVVGVLLRWAHLASSNSQSVGDEIYKSGSL